MFQHVDFQTSCPLCVKTTVTHEVRIVMLTASQNLHINNDVVCNHFYESTYLEQFLTLGNIFSRYIVNYFSLTLYGVLFRSCLY